ncbi:hypothetical protein QTJ16_000292 [Diplocarpon rosae]|uniref:Extracellular serine-rich protein n=1 Tax=Diplocarpon rosae TaxID=946125 RepID=A0AAD9T5N3_9HELO|nr:hypothetical protein QTJ16_000292 [Diplocarpon rosae]
MLFRVLSAAAFLFINTVLAFSVDSTVLIIAKDAASSYAATAGLDAYGIPFSVLLVPSNGTALPPLVTGGNGQYGGIVVLAELSYEYNGTYGSALTDEQWTSLFEYQTTFGVRMVRIDVYPQPQFGVRPADAANTGCCAAGVQQDVFISNTDAFAQAGMRVGATMGTDQLYHYPATKEANSTVETIEIAGFGTNSIFPSKTTAAVINKIEGREQMVWFISWAADWSPTSNYLQHAWITWVTRGLYVGFRRVYFSTQVDDMFLSSDLYFPNNTEYRIGTADLDDHVKWTKDINSRLPNGSLYFIEVGHNGNGNIQAAVVNDTTEICQPDEAIAWDENSTALEFQKPLGTGTNLWPPTPETYVWSVACTKLDALNVWWTNPANRDVFSHVSHTFSHLSLNNATYEDVYKEVTFNQAWLKQTGLTEAKRFSSKGLIPPAITGMHNGDALRAFSDAGLSNTIGDNTRPVLMNPDHVHWPLITTVEGNGFAGFQITPRWGTTIYYNCDLPECTVNEWIQTSAGVGDIYDLLADAKIVNSNHLLRLRHDPFMFHQANMRSADANETVVNGVSAKWSLLQMWTETVTQELARLVSWPLITLKQDDIADSFADRMALDKCVRKLQWIYSGSNTTSSGSNTTMSGANSTKAITGVTVSTANNTCSSEVPLTLPGPVVSTKGARSEQLGSDPLTLWVTLAGSPVTFTLSTPIPV